MLPILADQCINTNLIQELRRCGFKVERAAEIGLERAVDQEIFAYAVKHKRILLTFDKDFGNIIRFDIKNSSGVVIVYVEEMSREEILQRTSGFFRNAKPKLLKGSLFIIEPNRVRIWRH